MRPKIRCDGSPLSYLAVKLRQSWSSFWAQGYRCRSSLKTEAHYDLSTIIIHRLLLPPKALFGCCRIRLNPHMLEWIEFKFHSNPPQHMWIDTNPTTSMTDQHIFGVIKETWIHKHQTSGNLDTTNWMLCFKSKELVPWIVVKIAISSDELPSDLQIRNNFRIFAQ